MSFFLLKNNSMSEAGVINKKSIKDVGFDESQIRDLVAEQIDNFFPGLKTIATEFSDWEDSGRRLDILAIDRDWNLVVIELKRDKDAAHAELQALRYAAMLSVCTFENLVNAGWKYQKKKDPSYEEADYKKELLDFLAVGSAEKVVLSGTPKIILISSEFKKEITTTVLWLNEKFGMDISCFEVGVYDLQGSYGLHFDQIIPIAEAQEYQVRARVKNLEAVKQAVIKRRQRSISILEQAELLKPGTQIFVFAKLSAKFDIGSEKEKYATYLGGGKFKWDFDGKEYASLNALTGVIFDHYGDEMGSLQCPAYWKRVGADVSLAKEADQIPTNVSE